MKRNVFGGISIVITSIVVYLFNRYSIIDIPNVTWIRYIGIGIFLLGFVYLIYEVRKNLPFFYGRSQRGGSNANSYFIIGLGLGIVAKDLSVSFFALSILVTIIVSVTIPVLFSKK